MAVKLPLDDSAEPPPVLSSVLRPTPDSPGLLYSHDKRASLAVLPLPSHQPPATTGNSPAFLNRS
jgi:hypothetical protein